MEVKCPHCDKNLLLKKELAGKMFECPECRDLFHVPEATVAVENPVCPQCDYPMDRGDVICVRCGFNLLTKEKIETETDDETEGLSFLQKSVWWLYETMPGAMKPVHVLLFLVSIMLALLLEYLCLIFLLTTMMILQAIGIGALGLAVYAQGVAILVDDRIQPLNKSLIEFEGKQNHAFFWLTFGPAIGIFLLMTLAARMLKAHGAG